MRIFNFKSKHGFHILGGTERSQAASMEMAAGESTGGEDNRHEKSDQWLLVMEGTGEAVVNGRRIALEPGSLLLVEAGETHQVSSTGKTPLKTLNFYAPPEY